MKSFTQFKDYDSANELIETALHYKKYPYVDASLGKGKRIGLIFLNPSLRTRVSTQIAASNLGMEAIVLNIDQDGWALEFEDGVKMNKKSVEHVKEAAAVLGSYFDILALRAFPSLTDKEKDMEEYIFTTFAKYAGKPIISLESATRHPLQSLADMITIKEQKVKDKPKVVLTWAPHIKAIPHAVANSFAEWALGCDYDLTITHPPGYELDEKFTQGAHITIDQEEALKDADFVYVKNWCVYHDYGKIQMMGDDWMLTEEKLSASPNAKIMHCLPVRRNLEISDEILDGKRSLVQEQANNRVFAAQAVLSKILK
ncbi:Rossmann-fold NAD(P)-binding domain-containing protein [Anditalea andensis]|uniref:N-succinylornithine carbamoyltransferase n=1 Tax=Anditalea andensis TaxID=1048983 RepID=A0A074L0U4_9BACT|nr:acetylornithine carbamoyltransferase [Anditalea andensis]KEO75861.1 acetylornithine carbamoyltransferase [Anditalea andensis]